MGGMIEDIPPDAVYVPGAGGDLGMAGGEEASQLTLSFRGQVYVFDAVTPKKVLICCVLLVYSIRIAYSSRFCFAFWVLGGV